MNPPDIGELLVEYDRALAYTDSLWTDLSPEQAFWRASEEASGIAWHLGHQAAVAHFMVRNLIAAEPSLDVELERLMDSATPERQRRDLPDLERIGRYRDAVADRVRLRIGDIDAGRVGAPAQLRVIARTLLVAVINHEYQHGKWIGETRSGVHRLALPDAPASPRVSAIDGYFVVE